MSHKKSVAACARKKDDALPAIKLAPGLFADPFKTFWLRTVPVMLLWAACLGGYAWFVYGEGFISWLAMGLPVSSLALIYPRDQIRSTH